MEIGLIEPPQPRSVFKYLAPNESAEESVVTLTFVSWNPTSEWLRQLAVFRRAAEID
jgi:hypothetical protein